MQQHQIKTEMVNYLIAVAAAITLCASGCATSGFDTPLFSFHKPTPINQASASVYGIDQLHQPGDQLELVIDDGSGQNQSTAGSPNSIPSNQMANQPIPVSTFSEINPAPWNPAPSDTPPSDTPPSDTPPLNPTPLNPTPLNPVPWNSAPMNPTLSNQSQSVQSQPIPSDNMNNAVAGSYYQTVQYQPQTVVRGQSPDNQGNNVQPSTYQYPAAQPPQNSPPGSFLSPPPPGATFPQNYADVDIYLEETQTGRINFGGAYNSDNGIVGQFTIDERNFDIWRFPRSFRDITDGTAWRGAGQTFRLELVPGADVQRYLVSFGEPYLFNTPISLSASGYLFDRQYYDWDEQRLGGRVALGYRLTHDLSVSAGIRGESVDISDPRVNTSPQLNEVLGTSNLFLGNVGLIRDTRDHPFMATEGSYLAMTYNQAFGDYSYSRGDIDYRRYRLMYQRPDGSGRHTVSFGSKLGFSGSETPVFENYFAGGFSTMRGFDFRGASPVEGGVRVGGSFQWLNSLEYMFPITADDMIKGVVFCDYGTVEESVKLTSDNFRVAPGFGFRVQMPAMGIGAPLAFDFAFPVMSADTDDEQVFSFYLGVLR